MKAEVNRFNNKINRIKKPNISIHNNINRNKKNNKYRPNIRTTYDPLRIFAVHQ